METLVLEFPRKVTVLEEGLVREVILKLGVI